MFSTTLVRENIFPVFSLGTAAPDWSLIYFTPLMLDEESITNVQGVNYWFLRRDIFNSLLIKLVFFYH